MGTQEVSSHQIQHVFYTADAGVSGVAAVPAKLIFPHPFTVGDYKRWFRATMPDMDNRDDPDNDAFLAEYKAAMMVAALEEVLPEGDATHPTPFTVRDVVLMDGRVPDALPMTWATWVCDCAEKAFGSHFTLEGRQAKIARLSRATLPTDADTGTAVFSTNEPALLSLLPDLRAYPGKVTFPPYMNKTMYVRWQRALRPLPGVDSHDIDNTLLMRQYRAALELVTAWDVEGYPLKIAKHKDGEGLPLVLASWLVLAAEWYVAKTMSLKKIPALLGGT